MYPCRVPKLWNDTIASHRSQVRDAILDTAAALVFEHGLRAVTMAQIAEQAGIGRATLYKYFPDVDAILHDWHSRQIGEHLRQLAAVRDGAGDPEQRLTAMLTVYAHIVQQTRSHDTELVKFLHPDQQIADAQQQLRLLIGELIAEAAAAGRLRGDIDPAELANYCLGALAAAATLTDPAALTRLIDLTLTGLRAPAG
jgi:AcrR family transcriptional regulator